MARTSFPVEVLTPEGQVFADEVEMVSTRTTTGSIGILAHHASHVPLTGTLMRRSRSWLEAITPWISLQTP